MADVITRDGTRLSVTDWGSGDPVLFVHGGQLGAAMWEYQMVPLGAQGFRCIAYDRRGCGRSDHPGQGYDFDTLADDLATVITEPDLGDVTLVGHSMGCADIVRYLSRHGAARVGKAVLIAPTTPFLLQTTDNPDGVPRAMIDETVAALLTDRPALIAALAGPFFGLGQPGVEVSDEMVRWGIGLALLASPLATIEMTRNHILTDFRHDMSAFTMQTLVIHGFTDQSAPFALCGQATADAIPGSTLLTYDTGHGLFITERERLNADLLAFLQA
jgi:non-heme chloroperoxidase